MPALKLAKGGGGDGRRRYDREAGISAFLDVSFLLNCFSLAVSFNIIQMKEKEKEKRGDGETNIQVAIRVRPLNPKEIGQGESDIIRAQDNLIVKNG